MANPLDWAHFMKSGTTNTVLTVVLAVLVLAGVLFVLQTIFRQRELRTMQAEIVTRQSNMNRAGLFLTEAAQYGKTHPDIKPILAPFERKPAAHRAP